VLAGKDVMGEPLVKRRELLETKILHKLSEPIRYSPELKASLRDLIQPVKAQALEGLIAKAVTADTSRVSARAPGKNGCQSASGACK